MNELSRATRLLTAVATVTALLVGTTASAAPATDAGTQSARIDAALDRIYNGGWTRADLDYIRQFPKIAGRTSDPSQAGTEVVEKTGDNAAGVDSSVVGDGGESCGHWYRVWFNHRSILGSLMYTWTHKIVVCWIYGVRVTHFQVATDYIDNTQSLVVFENLVSAYHYVGPQGVANSYRKRHIELCFPIKGCYDNLYPWSRIFLGPMGGHGYKGESS